MAYLFLLLLFMLSPILIVVFVAMGSLLFVRPPGMRPAWWDWGLDEPQAIAKVETVAIEPVEPVAAQTALVAHAVEAELPPRVAAPEVAKRPIGPRW